jgi:heptosyltransferase II
MKVLIIRYSAIGDIILSTGPIRVLKDIYPEIEVHFVTSEQGAELLSGFVLIDKIHPIENHLSAWKFFKKIKTLGPFDHVIDLQAKPKTTLLKLLFRSRFKQIENQSYKRRLFVKKRKYKDDLNKHVVQKYYEAFKKCFELPNKSLEELRPFLSSKKIIDSTALNTNKIAIHPYASQKNKIWPYTYEIVEQLSKSGFTCVIVGQSTEPLSFNGLDNVLDLTNKTNLKEMASILSSCQAVISTDSGPMHLAVALSIPTIAIFGPTTKEFGFYPEFKNVTIIEDKDLECRPCHVHGGNLCPLGHHLCMKNLSVDIVLNALKKMI